MVKVEELDSGSVDLATINTFIGRLDVGDAYSCEHYKEGGSWKFKSPALLGNIQATSLGSKYGQYLSDYHNSLYKITEFICKENGKLGVSDRRVSIRMSRDEQQIMEAISLQTGALWGNQPSWAKVVRGLIDGSLICRRL